MSEKVRTGVIGGSGIYQVEGLKIIAEKKIRTPFGDPSDAVVIGRFDQGEAIAFLPRHGRGHRILPSDLNSRANIWALKSLGVERVVAISAVGSLKQEIEPRDIVVPGQIIDRTRGRKSTFFGDGEVGHVQFAEPFCGTLSGFLKDEIKKLGYKTHSGETYVCMEGPAFSTKAESHLYRSWGAGIIGMTALPEAKLAREAEMCYAVIAFATDYDCWYEGHESVSVEMVMQNFKANVDKAKNIIRTVIARIPGGNDCACGSAAAGSIMTDLGRIPAATKKKLHLLYGKYF
jgi:5'-methylthioadenosine phosphorylase